MLDLPTDRPRSFHRSTNGSKIPILLDAHLTLSLKKLAIEHDMDLCMVVVTGWSAVLARLSRQDDIVVGLHHDDPGGLENNHQAHNSNILPLRLDLSGEPNISQLLQRVQKTALSSMDHRGFPLDSIAEFTSSPLIQIALRWNQASFHSDTPIPVELELQLQEQNNEVVGSMLFSPDLFNPDTTKRHIGYLCSMLRTMVMGVDRPVTTVDLLSQDERDLLLGEWNDTQHDYSNHLCIHHLFEQQVELTPEATALSFNGQSLTYSEVNARANRLAHHLIRLGVQPDSLVAICVERSFAMIVGVLAVLKAGGAYVPLDPAYASERLRDILLDASPSILLADHIGQQTLEGILSSMTVVDPNMDTESSLR
jgi:non-ribosomal peptide synthetase component F